MEIKGTVQRDKKNMKMVQWDTHYSCQDIVWHICLKQLIPLCKITLMTTFFEFSIGLDMRNSAKKERQPKIVKYFALQFMYLLNYNVKKVNDFPAPSPVGM